MVKMQFVSCAALNTTPRIAFPYCQLDRRRNNPSTDWRCRCRHSEVFFTLDRLKPKFKDRTPIASLTPRINEMKHTVVR